MSTRLLSFKADDDQRPWTHWNQDVFGDWRANFYNVDEPYLRHTRQITVSGPSARKRAEEMRADVDAKAAAGGLVPFDKLPEDIQRYWAEADAAWLVADIVRHLEEKRGAS